MKYILFLFTIIFLLYPTKTYAQQFHLSIEPTVLQIDATPPARFEAPFQIKNLSDSTIKLKPAIYPMEADDSGKVRLKLNNQDTLSSYIKDRLKIIDGEAILTEIELRPNETKQLRLFMDVKKGDPAGDFYLSMVFMAEGTVIDETSTSSIPAGIAMNVLVSIGPKTPSELSIEEFSTKTLIGSGPVLFTLKVKNSGAHMIQPEGTMTVRNLFGKEVGSLKILPQYVLADTSRFLIDSNQASPSAEAKANLDAELQNNPSVIWAEKFLMGPYSAEVKLNTGANTEVITEKINFYAIPVQIILIISGIIFVVLGIMLRISIKLRKKVY